MPGRGLSNAKLYSLCDIDSLDIVFEVLTRFVQISRAHESLTGDGDYCDRLAPTER